MSSAILLILMLMRGMTTKKQMWEFWAAEFTNTVLKVKYPVWEAFASHRTADTCKTTICCRESHPTCAIHLQKSMVHMVIAIAPILTMLLKKEPSYALSTMTIALRLDTVDPIPLKVPSKMMLNLINIVTNLSFPHQPKSAMASTRPPVAPFSWRVSNAPAAKSSMGSWILYSMRSKMDATSLIALTQMPELPAMTVWGIFSSRLHSARLFFNATFVEMAWKSPFRRPL
jgi:hypothetical protein